MSKFNNLFKQMVSEDYSPRAEYEDDFYRGGDNSTVTTSRDIHAPDFTIPKGTEIKVLNKTELTHWNDLAVWFYVLNCPSDESLNGEASNILVSELF